MNSFQIVAILVSLAAIFAYINHRLLHQHPTVGIMLQSLLAAGAWIGVQHFWRPAIDISRAIQVNLHEALFHWMLGGLLFAGAMRVNLSELRNQRMVVMVLSIAGTLISTFTIAGLSFGICKLIHVDVTFISCALFGAVISPTDPVAVMGFLKTVKAPAEIEAIIGGESLFNDGVGVVLFTVLAKLAAGDGLPGDGIHWMNVPGAFVMQTVGGGLVGLVAGLIVYRMIRRVDNYQVEVLLTLALAMGGYTLADGLGVSGPIAAVAAGLVIGNRSRGFAVPDKTRLHLDDFWELIDETLNAVLFLLVGLTVLQMHFAGWEPIIQLSAVILVLFARWMSVKLCLLSIPRKFGPALGVDSNTMVAVLTWGGLRGGLALAMALSLPPTPTRDRLVAAVFGVVVFSVLVQGATLPALFRKWFKPTDA